MIAANSTHLNHSGGFAVDGELEATGKHDGLALAVLSGCNGLDLCAAGNIASTAVFERLAQVLEAGGSQAWRK